MDKRDIQIFKILGQNIKYIRELKEISLEQVSQKTGIRLQYLKRIENGEAYGVTTTQIFVIAEALNVYPHELVKGI
ncbi:MAG: helix-turn-helix transcriptional regulator [Candidatus Gastranaerophilales bacterium]|nr:helix-turn-helix transcriptional regulator [Candidatus Gastranaerophilales bacterium]